LTNNRLILFAGETPLYSTFHSTAFNLAVADFNRDGKVDLLTGNKIFVTGAPGPYCAATGYGFNRIIFPSATGDFNNDGRPDIVGAGSENGLHLFLNQSLTVGTVAAVSAASYNSVIPSPFADVPTIVPDQIVAAFGSGLATSTAVATTANLPTTLAGTQVRVRDFNGTEHLAPLFFVSPNQVNFLVPPNLVLSNLMPDYTQVTITNSNNLNAQGVVSIGQIAPGLFAANANGKDVAAALVLRITANGTQRYEDVARFDTTTNRFVPVPIDLSNANEQVFLVLYGTGYRRRAALRDVTTTVGGVACETLYAGAQGQLAGLDQINVRLPRSLAGRGNAEVIVSVSSVYENKVSVTIK
jgi:uncharacterized protein (TIGR03437 family)